MEFPKIQQFDNAWEAIFKNDGHELPAGKYVVAYGNSYHGYLFDTKEELIRNWRHCLKRAKFQDLALYFDKQLIRGVSNFNCLLIEPSATKGFGGETTYTTVSYRKYEYQK